MTNPAAKKKSKAMIGFSLSFRISKVTFKLEADDEGSGRKTSMPEDDLTLATRKILIANARSLIGSHYINATNGDIPGNGKLIMLPTLTEPVTVAGLPDITEWSTVFTAQNGPDNGKKKRCPGRYEHKDVVSRPKGDHNNPDHLANPDAYRWQRLVRFNNQNPLYGESCVGKWHFDCIGFIRFCLKQVIPKFYDSFRKTSFNSIPGMTKNEEVLVPVSTTGVRMDDLCVGDILIRTGKSQHIAFAIGGGPNVIHAEWEPSGVVETVMDDKAIGKWTFHGRIAQAWWLGGWGLEP